jgi:hypothetical protein
MKNTVLNCGANAVFWKPFMSENCLANTVNLIDNVWFYAFLISDNLLYTTQVRIIGSHLYKPTLMKHTFWTSCLKN